MFTRCPECETTFRLGAQDLRRAGGKVRCGECATIFNALDYLEEDAQALSRAGNPQQFNPASGAQDEPEAEHGAFGADGDPADSRYADDDDGPIGDPTDSLLHYPGTAPNTDTETDTDADADADADDEPGDANGAGILVIESDDDNPAGDGTAWIADSSFESGLDSTAADRALADEPERWPAYAEPDDEDDDDIVSFVTAPRRGEDYPEVSAAVGAAIGIGPAADTDDLEDEDASYPADEVARSDEPGIVFDEELLSAADETIEFIISDDADDEFVQVPSLDDNDDSDGADDQGVVRPTDAANDDIDEFDDTIWERIPGVGSTLAETDDSRFARPGFRQPESTGPADAGEDQRREPVILDEPAIHIRDEDDSEEQPDTASGADSLEFDAPADTWSSIFSRTNRAASAPDLSGDTQPLPAVTRKPTAAEAEELAAWSRELIDEDSTGEPRLGPADEAEGAADDRADWVSELSADEEDAAGVEGQSEWLAEGGENAASAAADFDSREDWVTEQDYSGAADDSPQPDPVAAPRDGGDNADKYAAESSPEQTPEVGEIGEYDDEPDESAAAESVRGSDDDIASLTAAFATGKLDEADYDVQHIVLADESEEDNTGLTQAFSAAAREDLPPWRPNAPEHLPTSNARALFWLVGGMLVVATLALQLVHYNRDALAGSRAWGGSIRSIYQRLGMELYPNWSLDDYEIRGSEAIAGESGPDVMDVRAQIAAVGKEPVGLPHIRLVLRDRWSNPVAAKTVAPAEYAAPGSLPPDAMLQPNETLAAHVSIIDPGSGAQGFELELCLPRRHTGLQCTGRPFE